MNPVLTILINVTVAGFVGGITNHYAIKMLFHPREEKRIGRFRVPFTPGLIPKRKDEIGRSLGKVVADHLVTAEGLRGLLSKPAFRQRMEERLAHVLDGWMSREDTVEELLLRIWSREELERRLDGLALQASGWTRGQLRLMWTDEGWAERRLGGLVPGWSEERRNTLTEQAVVKLIEELRKELESLRGERMLRQITSSFMEQAGGFLGSLASMFMDADKVTGRVKAALLEQLESPAMIGFAYRFIQERLIRLEETSLEDAVRLARADAEPLEWLEEQAGQAVAGLRRYGWEKLRHQTLRGLLEPRRGWLQERIPLASGMLLDQLVRHMPRLVEAVQLPLLVEEEVRKFPIELVENIILSVSGKEFRAITWLGVLLGGMIGLLQSLFLIWQS
ncbi:DUF445 family protein [Gorillibacterium sp. sgz5001074]|uniref:DUF445 family protein n=1 Tax=Gorillibacterium sp. sgz5001074 TaxID=3446695 RepID=UPI003F67057E